MNWPSRTIATIIFFYIFIREVTFWWFPDVSSPCDGVNLLIIIVKKSEMKCKNICDLCTI